MSVSLNRVQLIGNVGNDPEVRQAGNSQVASVSLATSKTIRAQDKEPREETQWHQLAFWGKKAELVQKYVQKGAKLFIEGELRYSEKEGKKYTNITVTEFVIISGGKTAEAPKPKPVPKPAPKPVQGFEDDDLPF